MILIFSEASDGLKDGVENESTMKEYQTSPSQFICDNEEVISFLGRCDNKTDCLDGSDEANCHTTMGKNFSQLILKGMTFRNTYKTETAKAPNGLGNFGQLGLISDLHKIVRNDSGVPEYNEVLWTMYNVKTLGIHHGYNIDENAVWMDKIKKDQKLH